MSDSSASEDPTKTMPSTAGERFGVVGAKELPSEMRELFGLKLNN